MPTLFFKQMDVMKNIELIKEIHKHLDWNQLSTKDFCSWALVVANLELKSEDDCNEEVAKLIMLKLTTTHFDHLSIEEISVLSKASAIKYINKVVDKIAEATATEDVQNKGTMLAGIIMAKVMPGVVSMSDMEVQCYDLLLGAENHIIEKVLRSVEFKDITPNNPRIVKGLENVGGPSVKAI